MQYINVKNNNYKSNDSIIFTISDNPVAGKLYISENHDNSRYIDCYICHNNEKYNGSVSPNRLNYKYSWQFNLDTKDNSIDSSDVKIICYDIISEEKDNCEIDDEFIYFLQSNDLQLVDILFHKQIIFSNFNKIEISDKTGLVKLTNLNDNRFFEIKFGRFLTKINNFLQVKFTNKEIEIFTNNFLAFQKNKNVEIVELKGDDILFGYNTENYLDLKSSLGGSCMNNKTNLLNIYTTNPNTVSLLVIKIFGKVAGRCLVWNTSEGRFADKRYTCSDWVISKFNKIIQDRNLTCIYDLSKKVNIQLNCSFEKYPYLDTFKYLNLNTSTITNIIDEETNNFKYLTNTDGTFRELD